MSSLHTYSSFKETLQNVWTQANPKNYGRFIRWRKTKLLGYMQMHFVSALVTYIFSMVAAYIIFTGSGNKISLVLDSFWLGTMLLAMLLGVIMLITELLKHIVLSFLVILSSGNSENDPLVSEEDVLKFIITGLLGRTGTGVMLLLVIIRFGFAADVDWNGLVTITTTVLLALGASLWQWTSYVQVVNYLCRSGGNANVEDLDYQIVSTAL